MTMVTTIEGDNSLSNTVSLGKREEPEKPKVPPESASVAPAVPVPPAYGFRLRVDEETKEVTVLIVDPETKAVIREIPSEEMQIASDVIRNLLGPLIDKTV